MQPDLPDCDRVRYCMEYLKKKIATLEGALQKLSEQEAKYYIELDESLKQYAELKEQAVGMDAVELMDARLAMREEKERWKRVYVPSL